MVVEVVALRIIWFDDVTNSDHPFQVESKQEYIFKAGFVA